MIPHVLHTCAYEVLLSGDSYEAKSHVPFSYGLLAEAQYYEEIQ